MISDGDFKDNLASWAQTMDVQWELHFEQHKLPTEEQIVQINVGDHHNPKPYS